jgi:diguanylate cyclase (GGDEF)-like protein
VIVTGTESQPMHSFIGALERRARERTTSRQANGRRRLGARERRAEGIAAAAFLATAVLMAVAFGGTRALDAGMAATLVIAFALVRQVKFEIGAGFVVPTQLVFVPMLFLLPADVLPLFVAAGMLLGTAIEVLVRRAHPERALVKVANGWFAIGPALLFAAADIAEPTWAVCFLAFAAQLVVDLGASTIREWLCSSIPPRLQARVIGETALVDGLLWPIGLLAALASAGHPGVPLLVLPLGALLALLAHDRTARLVQVRSQTARLERATHRMGRTFASGLDRDATLALAIDAAIDVTEAHSGRVTHVGDEAAFRRSEPGPSTPAAERLLHAAERAALEANAPAAVPASAPTAMAIPLKAQVGDGRDGTIALSVARPSAPFSAEERRRFQELGRQAAVSVENVALHERLARQATTDELTGLLNHRRLHEILAQEIERAPRFRPSLALVMLDIDDFKRVNDTYGHQQGDQVLFAVARAVESAARQGDHVARYGGEEVAIVLPHADLSQARGVAERIRERIASTAVPLPGGGAVRPTASLGVAVLSGDADKEQLIAAADAALYEAKRGGKNRTVCAPQAVGAPLRRA